MKFEAENVFDAQLGEMVRLRFINNSTDIINPIQFSSRKGTSKEWVINFQRIEDSDVNCIEKLLDIVPDLLVCEYSDDIRGIYFDFLAGLFFYLHGKLSKNNQREGTGKYSLHKTLLQQNLFIFKIEPKLFSFEIQLSFSGQELIIARPRKDSYNSDSQGVWDAMMATGYKNYPENFLNIIHYYPFFRENVEKIGDRNTEEAFSLFTKSLIAFSENVVLEKAYDQGNLKKYIPEMCSFVVKSEYENLEHQKAYLGKLLQYLKNNNLDYELLQEIISDIKLDLKRGDNRIGRLESIISLIAEHFLDQYEIDKAVSYWNLLEKKDLFLTLQINFINKPYHYLWAELITFGFLVAISILTSSLFVLPILFFNILIIIGRIVILSVFLISLVGIIWVIVKLLIKKNLYYAQLFLPKLMGAIIVGLSALIVQDTPWYLGISTNFISLLYISVFIYGLSFLYIFVEVHNTVKYYSITTQQNLIEKAINISKKIFVIGLVESLYAIFLSTTIFFSAIGIPQTLINETLLKITIINPVQLGFFPTLIFFWTGLALFIGSFVQLIWQDNRITS
ncbi:MAG: hypothetical protein WCK35_04850 [Chloroflexota bacterium]